MPLIDDFEAQNQVSAGSLMSNEAMQDLHHQMYPTKNCPGMYERGVFGLGRPTAEPRNTFLDFVDAAAEDGSKCSPEAARV